MAEVYASLIVKNIKTIDQVPTIIRDKVKQVLISWGHPELAGNI